MSSDICTHWCHSCILAVRPYGAGTICPNCGGGFVQNLNNLEGNMGNFPEMELSDDLDTQNCILDSISAFMRQRTAAANENGNHFSRDEEYNELLEAGDPYADDDGNTGYLSGPELEELINQLSVNDRQGPPPAVNSAIDTLPSIKIKKSHLRGDCHCAVCMEKFELGALALKMPCKHLYHPDCIVPWLTQHDTCPVCRKGISKDGCDDDDGGAKL